MSRRARLVEAVLFAALAAGPTALGAAPAADPAAPPRRDLTELSLTDLAGLEVTTVARSPETLSHTPAAVFVITNQDIRRSGAKTLSEALRLAPGVQISRIDASQPTVGIRGFGSRLARSVLVLIDGRSVYTPLFAGTYWEVQDVLLEDIDRIEVIRGPGGTLWGANAVNGVINIITRRARDTHGTYLEAGAGNEERAFGAARWGGALGPHADLRVYAKYADRDAAFHADGPDYDDWRIGQGGFRLDAERAQSQYTLQGDVYEGRAGERTTFASYTSPFARTVFQDADLGGGNLRGLWQRPAGKAATVRLQAYYDHTRRVEPNFSETRDTGDFDLQYDRRDGRNQLLGGLGYRLSRGATGGVPTILFIPPTRTDNIWSAFLQDRIDLSPDRLSLTVGAKVERNDYSGVELQPSVRLLWVPRPRHTLWAAVSRAVRTPSRVDRDLDLTSSVDPSQPVFSRAGRQQLSPGCRRLPQRLRQPALHRARIALHGNGDGDGRRPRGAAVPHLQRAAGNGQRVRSGGQPPHHRPVALPGVLFVPERGPRPRARQPGSDDGRHRGRLVAAPPPGAAVFAHAGTAAARRHPALCVLAPGPARARLFVLEHACGLDLAGDGDRRGRA
jgi:iron complex outermembrane receptor protein